MADPRFLFDAVEPGYLTRPGPNAPVVGPRGLAFDALTDTLYVASTGDNEIFAIWDASDMRRDNGIGRVVVNDQTHLHGPLGMVLVPNGWTSLAGASGLSVHPWGGHGHRAELTSPKRQPGPVDIPRCASGLSVQPWALPSIITAN